MNNNLRKQRGENCSICCKLWKKGQSSIKCYNCKKFIHGPIAKSKSLSCSLLTLDEFNLYTNPSIYKSWICPKCCANEFPFHEVCTNTLFLENIEPRNP